jgi:predicted dehydrogenase
MRIGILGAGWAGSTHAEAYVTMPDVEIAGIVGRREARVHELAEGLNVSGFTDPRRILDDETVDAVDVCYPTFIHREYVIAALERGKHVFCETPMALSLEDADAMIAMARSSGKLLLVAQVMRFVDAYVYIRDALRSGELGKPQVVFASRLSSGRHRGERPATEFGGPLVELMIHDFDYLNWLVGKPTAVRSTGFIGPTGEVDYACVALEHEEMYGQLEGSVLMPLNYPFSTRLRVVCEEGAIETSFRFYSERPETVLTRYPISGLAEEPEIPDEDPYWAECRHFVDNVDGRVDARRLSAEAAREGLEVALAAKASLEQDGKRVSLTD